MLIPLFQTDERNKKKILRQSRMTGHASLVSAFFDYRGLVFFWVSGFFCQSLAGAWPADPKPEPDRIRKAGGFS